MTTDPNSNVLCYRVTVTDTGHVVLPSSDGRRYPFGRVPHSLSSGLSAPLYWYQYQQPYKDQREADRPLIGTADFNTERSANAQASMARKCGLAVKVTPILAAPEPVTVVWAVGWTDNDYDGGTYTYDEAFTDPVEAMLYMDDAQDHENGPWFWHEFDEEFQSIIGRLNNAFVRPLYINPDWTLE